MNRGGAEARRREMKTWWFQGNPAEYRIDLSIRHLREQFWLTPKLHKEMAVGDRVFLWRTGKDAALVAVATIITPPREFEVPPEQRKYEVRACKIHRQTDGCKNQN